MSRRGRIRDVVLSTDPSLISKKLQRSAGVAPASLRFSRARRTKFERDSSISRYLTGIRGLLFPDTSKTLASQIHVLARLFRGAYSHYRVMFGLPVNGQKSRSNAKTMRRIALADTLKVLKRMRLTKRSVGKIYGDAAKAKRLRAKLKPSGKGVKSKNQKKKPTVRSRDSKKSVWS